MKIDYHLLNADTLRALVEEFVLRDGTDYGEREASLDTKVGHVMKLLEQGKIKLVFDAETESCDLREENSLKLASKTLKKTLDPQSATAEADSTET